MIAFSSLVVLYALGWVNTWLIVSVFCPPEARRMCVIATVTHLLAAALALLTQVVTP